jgi:hypothetical protein
MCLCDVIHSTPSNKVAKKAKKATLSAEFVASENKLKDMGFAIIFLSGETKFGSERELDKAPNRRESQESGPSGNFGGARLTCDISTSRSAPKGTRPDGKASNVGMKEFVELLLSDTLRRGMQPTEWSPPVRPS